MTLAAGTKLGPYEVLSPLGAGGMGEVYKARDTRLDREVAIKVLPPQLSENAEFRQRFEREAKAISQLSHPHVCALYDVGRQDGVEYLVMELLDGQTLADRLDRGALPLEQTLRVGVEIADALEKAHKRGIVHRDLKPGNVMLTKSGVKLLDFGLAKSVAPEREAAFTSLPTEAARPLTEKGTVMGTFQYMAPEQLEGKEADARSDIFALGCVLYEMASGKKAFSGSSRASTIAAILEREPPPISSITPMTPPALDRVVRTCLAKDPDDRWQSAHDVKSELQWIAEAGSQAGAPAAVVSRRKSRERFAWAGFAVALAAAAVFAALWLRRGSADRILRASIDLPEKSDFSLYLDPAGPGKLSPDGRAIAFTAVRDGKYQIWIRPLDSVEARPLAGTDNGSYPFWSPDSQWLAFFAAGKLQKIA
ncbi:MAG TPA: protein kinase, partial [Thermoanaerobaculia bacterium]|nr:protein kinase [Thermoanaerobaculia bacterium]